MVEEVETLEVTARSVAAGGGGAGQRASRIPRILRAAMILCGIIMPEVHRYICPDPQNIRHQE